MSRTSRPHDDRCVVIETAAAARELRAADVRHTRIEVRSPYQSTEEQTVWSQRLTALSMACGCEAGAAALLITTMGLVFGAIASARVPTLPEVGIALFAVIWAALLGKAGGLALARWRLTRSLTQLAVQLGAATQRSTAQRQILR
jgi:hypothetical protein